MDSRLVDVVGELGLAAVLSQLMEHARVCGEECQELELLDDAAGYADLCDCLYEATKQANVIEVP